MHLLLFLAYSAVVSAGHCRQGGRPKSWPQPVSSSSSTTSSAPATSSTSTFAGSGLGGGLDNLGLGGAPTSTTLSTVTSSAAVAPSSSSAPVASSPKISTSLGGGLKASFTHYGGCKTNTVACGFFGGFNAAVSENLFGVGPGAGPGPACNTCYSLSSSTPGTKSIVVKVNNLCPREGNAQFCAQSGMGGTNSVGANVNFDLCQDDGSSAAFFGSSNLGMTTGTATPIACP